ncbi:MAG: pantetheine-phosphate adenylyltransferase [Kiloniellales bacterium]|nr:pantetheine-phosphate adenylyltransferase [Kiloniellales bacterium]
MGERPRVVGVYPGTFDPITKGHSDIILRAAGLMDRLIVAVAANAGKGPLFNLDERVAMVAGEIKAYPPKRADISVTAFSGLLMEFCRDQGAQVLVRGLRAVSDFEYEFQMAAMNARLEKNVETLFFMASEQHQFISSSFVKEIGQLGGDISTLVSDRVRAQVEKKAGLKKA